MSGLRSQSRFLIQLIVLMAIYSTACGVQATPSACGAGVAQITVTDTFIRRDCGCAEAGGVSFSAQAFQCTLTVGTRLFIYYLNIQSQHQLVFGATAIGALPNHDPSLDGNRNPIDAITFSVSNPSLTFADRYSGIGGIFIVH